MPGALRVRPSGVGFVLMERPQDVDAIVALGEEQMVNGCQILVRRFQDRAEHRRKLEDELFPAVDSSPYSNREVPRPRCSADTDSEASETSTFASSVSTRSSLASLPCFSF